jgi:hypothetical protein
MTTTKTNNTHSPLADINQMSLALLSTTAAELWEQLKTVEIEEDADLKDPVATQRIEEKISKILSHLFEVQGVIEDKVDAIAYIADLYKTDIATDEFRLKQLCALHERIIEIKKNKFEAFKRHLVFLHQAKILDTKLIGKHRKIEFRNNPPKATILKNPNSDDFPAEYLAVKFSANTQAIIDAWKAGEDVSDVAQITVGTHMRFGATTDSISKAKPS